MPKDDFRFHFSLRVRWSECDAQGIAWAGSYMEYLEVAQSEYYRNLGVRIYDGRQRTYFDTATVKVTLEYKAPLRVDDMLDIYSRVARIGSTSMVQETEIYREGSDELAHRAETVSVNYDSSTATARGIPDDIRELVTHFERTGEVLPIDRFPDLALS